MDIPATDRPPRRDELVSWFEDAATGGTHRIGTEQEKFGFHEVDGLLQPIGYPEIAKVLEALVARYGWRDGPDHGIDGERVMLVREDASITLEPGGQFELSGAPLETLHQTCGELSTHHDEIDSIGRDLGITWAAVGFTPFATRDEIPWMPKGRYAVMREYLPTRGARAHDMMKRTCTVQCNLDYVDEAQCGRRLQAALKLSPLMTALFANSPYYEGKANGLQSNRSDVWSDVDPDRCGIPRFLVEDPFSYERYVDWALGVPMFFVKRQGRYIPHHATFVDFLCDGIEDPSGTHHHATWDDWLLHLSTLFPEVRIKPFIEIRGCDSVGSRFVCALPAVTKGSMYQADATQQAAEIVADLDHAGVVDLWQRARRDGLHDPDILERARRLVGLARKGLDALDNRDRKGRTEARFLDALDEDLAQGKSPGDLVREQIGEVDGRTPEGRRALVRGFRFAGTEV
jgi:glutamate--cysteine ligase